MADFERPKKKVLAVRCHDITTSLGGKQVADFDQLVVIGMAVRLALHLRGVQAVPYEILRQIGLHLLHIPPTSLPLVIDILGEAGFVRIDKQGNTIRSIVPTVPYYDDLFEGMGELASSRNISEPEWLTLTLVERLSKGPVLRDHVHNIGAEQKLVKRMVAVGTQGGYLLDKRARGKNVLLSPVYQPENADAFADLVAGTGSTRVEKVFSAISKHQGWPLCLIQKTGSIGRTPLSPEEIKVVVALAGDGFAPPPAIETTHAGKNFFIFGPKPGFPRLTPTKRHLYETAMALVAAVRQGQLLPARYAIHSPLLLLQRLKENKHIRANTEALEQYRKLTVLRLGRLVRTSGDWHRFELIDNAENLEAVDMAIRLVAGEEPLPAVEDEVVLALRKGQSYVESLLARQLLVAEAKIDLDPESQSEIDDLLLRGAK